MMYVVELRHLTGLRVADDGTQAKDRHWHLLGVAKHDLLGFKLRLLIAVRERRRTHDGSFGNAALGAAGDIDSADVGKFSQVRTTARELQQVRSADDIGSANLVQGKAEASLCGAMQYLSQIRLQLFDLSVSESQLLRGKVAVQEFYIRQSLFNSEFRGIADKNTDAPIRISGRQGAQKLAAYQSGCAGQQQHRSALKQRLVSSVLPRRYIRR